jgi:superfamily II DNA or RNA helicase
MTDGHLHVIAPPGSGKTVLGLEVMLRLNSPSLILAPTIAVCNQWVERFCELFLQTDETPKWISRDIRHPAFLTISTYQGLHSALNNETHQQLFKQGIRTIVADEAHHLRNEWWHTLMQVKTKLSPVRIIGLTATPPYDVSPVEWERYIEFNGSIDTEISVPELIAEGDLCPHQDYIHFTYPTEEEVAQIRRFRENIERWFCEIKNDPDFVRALESHPAWRQPTEELEWIYTHLRYYSAMLIYLHEAGREIPPIHLEVIGDRKLQLPPLNYEWMEILLDFYLYKEKTHFDGYASHREALEHRLSRLGAMEKHQIILSHNQRINNALVSSIGKMEGIYRIAQFEYDTLGHQLRMVILSDFIRKDYLPDGSEHPLPLNKTGVVPVFEKLRRNNPKGIKLGVLTGTLAILPREAYAVIRDILPGASPFPGDDRYILIRQTEPVKQRIVHIITRLFQDGAIEILVGTKSLLGEGWDAPAVNSLVLATFVGSFMLSNQMRGRAIRTQAGNPDKTGNIWHLVCLDPTSTLGGEDFDRLSRRFRSFVGISAGLPFTISNGIQRLHLPGNMMDAGVAERTNEVTYMQAQNRRSLKHHWEEALAGGVNLIEELKVAYREKKPYRKLKQQYLVRTIASMLLSLGMIVGEYAKEFVVQHTRLNHRMDDLRDVLIFVGLFFVGAAIGFGGYAFRTLRLYLKYRDISKDIRQIGEALLQALVREKTIQTSLQRLSVSAEPDLWGDVYCSLRGGTEYECSLFTETLREIVEPVDNPRYIIIRKSSTWRLFRQQDYHAVPEILGRNKNTAEYFAQQWQRLVGPCELIYTRNIEGRRLILRSRIQSLASQLGEKTERINVWR